MGRGVIVALQGAANGANRMNAGNRFSRGADRLLAVVNIDRSGRVNELPLGLARWELERRRRGIVCDAEERLCSFDARQRQARIFAYIDILVV